MTSRQGAGRLKLMNMRRLDGQPVNISSEKQPKYCTRPMSKLYLSFLQSVLRSDRHEDVCIANDCVIVSSLLQFRPLKTSERDSWCHFLI